MKYFKYIPHTHENIIGALKVKSYWHGSNSQGKMWYQVVLWNGSYWKTVSNGLKNKELADCELENIINGTPTYPILLES